MKYLIGAAASLLLLFAGILIVLETDKGTIRIEVDGEIDGVDVKNGAITLSRRDEKVVRILHSSFVRPKDVQPKSVKPRIPLPSVSTPHMANGGTTRPAVQRRLWHKPEAVEQGGFGRGFGGVRLNNYAAKNRALA